MFPSIMIGVICFFLLIYYLTRDPHAHIPGPSLWTLLRDYKFDISKTHLLFTELKAKYGPIFKLPRIGEPAIVVLSDFESIYQVSVSEGKAFGGRPTQFGTDAILDRTGIILNYNPDDKWKCLRKTTQRHLRQFGDGMSRLEAITVDMAEDMFLDLSKNVGKPYNPKNIFFDTALNTIVFLILGKRIETGEPVVEMMREYENRVTKLLAVEPTLGAKILNVFPWVRYLGVGSWDQFKRLLDIEVQIWNTAVKYSEDNPDTESICKEFRDQLASDKTNISELDARKSTLTLLVAGVVTTSNSLYALTNILAHNRDIQDKINKEIRKIQEKTNREPSLQDRPNMHYSRAVLLELGRYASVAVNGVLHRNLTESKIKGLKIPANTTILLNQWDLHHDEKFWDKPYSFIPERFLDESGEVVPPDHPNRKHLMPFGAGPRVCIGETLALTRLFLWMVTLVQRFTVEPVPGNDVQTTDPRQFSFETILRPTPYEVIFKKREEN